MKTFKILSIVFAFVLISSYLHAQQTTTLTRIIDGDTIQALYGGAINRGI